MRTLLGVVGAGIAGAIFGCGRTGPTSADGDRLGVTMTIPVRAVVAQRDQAPLKFPSLALCGSPAHEVRRLLRRAEREYEDEHRALQSEFSRLEAEQSATESKLDSERATLAKEYNEKAPRSDDPEYQSRNPVAGLVKARAAKSRLDEWYKQAFRSRIAPLEEDLKQVQGGIESVQDQIARLRESFSDRLFAALPTKPAEVWKTDADGRASIAISRNEPWFIWAKTDRVVATTVEIDRRIDPTGRRVQETQRAGGFKPSHYRWLTLVPDQLDSSGQLVLDQSNLFDGRAISMGLREADDDAPVVRPVGQ